MSKRLLGLCVCGALALGSLPSGAGVEGGQTLLIVPARQTLVKIAFDMAYLRPVNIAAYCYTTNSPEALFFVWNPSARQWVASSLSAVAACEPFRGKPKQLLLVGSDAEFPPLLAQATAWCEKNLRVNDLALPSLFNTLNGCFRFSTGEWEMLARRYELTLRDQNAERRKYGRYGPPGTKRMKIETQNGGATDGVPLPAPAAQGSVAQPPLVTGRPVLLIEAGTPPSGVAVLPPPAPVAVLSPVATNAPPVAVPAPAAP